MSSVESPYRQEQDPVPKVELLTSLNRGRRDIRQFDQCVRKVKAIPEPGEGRCGFPIESMRDGELGPLALRNRNDRRVMGIEMLSGEHDRVEWSS